MSIPITILLTAISAVVVLLSLAVGVAFIRSRRLAKSPPPPPRKCPACDSEQIEVFHSGLWDGYDSEGRETGGTSQVGTCKSCGVHCEHFSIWEHGSQASRYESRVLTDDEWQRETAPTLKRQREAAEWPFISGGQNHVAWRLEGTPGERSCCNRESSARRPSAESAMTIKLMFIVGCVTMCGCDRQSFPSGSMEPTIKRGEKISVDYTAYIMTAPKRWDVVAFEHPSLTNQVWIKRVVALPGETVTFASGGVTVNGVPLVPPAYVSNVVYVSVDYFGPYARGTLQSPYPVPTNAYFLLGDCSTNSYDSRIWGAVDRAQILGKVRGK